MESKTYENFPAWIVFISSAVAISIYAVGVYIMTGFGILVSFFYILYCFWVETGVLKKSCVNCYYYGKVCGLGRGKLCSLLFKKGDPQEFIRREISWKDMLPDIMVSLFPLLGGIILLVRDFTWLIVVLMALLVILTFGGNALVRGSFACKYCKQKDLGCPAQKLFNKQKDGSTAVPPHNC
jgi:hypothetical protein